MKKILLLTFLAAGLLTQSALATITITATPSTQSVAAGGTFNVTFSLSVTQATAPANVAGFDLYLATITGNSGRFAITTATGQGVFTSLGPTEPNGGDFLSTTAATGFVRNGVDQGFLATANQTTPVSGLALERLTLSVAVGTPAGNYTFSTSTAANAGAQFTRITDSNGTTYQIDNPGTFSITVVPEPSTWALLLAGTGAVLGITSRRQRMSSTHFS